MHYVEKGSTYLILVSVQKLRAVYLVLGLYRLLKNHLTLDA